MAEKRSTLNGNVKSSSHKNGNHIKHETSAEPPPPPDVTGGTENTSKSSKKNRKTIATIGAKQAAVKPKKPNVTLTAEDLYEEKLASSGLSLRTAADLGMRFVSDAGKLLPNHKNQSGVLLPYHDFDGKPTGFFRVRLLTQPRSFAAEAVKPQRYVQPPDTGVAAYFPRSVKWRDIVSDSTRPIYVTEGEFKAACACENGLPTIGLGGVYSWRSAKGGIAFLPELDEVAWAGRHVFVVFDSDAQTNHNVMRALRHLCAELTSRGALPFIAKLPALPDHPKTGLDDFVVARGADALADVFEAAEQYGLAEELWKLNDRVCFVRDPGFVLELATGQRMNVMSFSREVYANLFYIEREEGPKGARIIKKSTAQEWVKWAHRLEAQRITYRPGSPRFTAEGELNTWRGSGVEPIAGDSSPWSKLLDHLFDGDPDAREWFERWCALPLQRPGRKILSAVVMWGVHQGTGKTLLGYSLSRLLGEHNVSEITQDHLRSQYNDWLVDKQLIIGEEITGSDRRADADRIKALITQATVRVSAKYVREYSVPAVANFFFTSNHPDAFFLEDTDRRFFVHEVRRPPLPMRFYKDYAKWLRSDEGASALLAHLLAVDLGNFDPDGPAYETAAKREMIEDNKSDLAAWILRLKREPRAVLKSCGMPDDTELLSTSQLRAMYDPADAKRVTTNGMGRELKRSLVLRLPTVVIPLDPPTSYRLYAIQNPDKWRSARAQDAAAHWMERFGGKP